MRSLPHDGRRLLSIAVTAGVLAAGAFEAARPPPAARGLDLSPARASHPARSARTPDARRVEIAGCRAVTAGPAGTAPVVCEVPRDGRLRVWVDATAGERVAVTSNGGPAIPRPLPPGQGRLFQVHVRPEAPWLHVDVPPGGAGLAAHVVLAPARADDALDALFDMRRTDPRAAEHLAARHLADDDPATQARAAGLVARIRRDSGDLPRARDLFARAIERDRVAGRISDLYADTFALAYTLGVQLRRFDEARAVLADLAPLRDAGLASPAHEAHARYYAALIAHEAGDLRAALDNYRASREHAARLGDLDHRADVLSQEALLLLDLGRASEGAALYEQAAPVAEGLGACAKATFYNNWASFLLHAASAAPEARARPAGEPLGKALALVESECQVDQLRGYVAMSLAQVSLREGDLDAARAAVDAAASLLSPTDKHDAAELADVAAQVATAEGDLVAAWDAYGRLAEIAGSAVLPHYRRRAALGRAELLEEAGAAAAAAAAHEEVARLIEQDSLLTPLGEGRLGFLEQLDRGAARSVAFLLERPDGAALAAAVARRSIAHMLSSLETVERIAGLSGEERRAWEAKLAAYRLERAHIEDEASSDWRLPADERARAAEARRAREERARAALDEALAAATLGSAPRRALAAPRAGELFLVYFALSETEWVGFAIEPSGVVARRLPDVSGDTPAALAERFLSPFARELDRATHVRFFAPRALRSVSFHALPHGPGVLAERALVTYGLDVRARADAAPASGAAPSALVVADPQGSLPEARGEGELVRREALARGLDVSLLSARLPQKASHARVRATLERAPLWLFHFAGHAKFSGNDGWDSQIPLADGGALRVGDILSLGAAPRLVVLSGCETGRSDGLGLAHAFVAAGASAAVGTTQVVPDADAVAVMQLFYENLRWDEPPADAAARALRAAVREVLRAGRGGPAWQAFRVFVP